VWRFQYALIECARNVLGNQRPPDSARIIPPSKNIIIYPVACAVPNRRNDSQIVRRVPEIRLRPGSYLHSFYITGHRYRRVLCNFEVNPEYEWAALEAGFPWWLVVPTEKFVPSNRPHTVSHIATLFQPQLSSKPNDPHPLVMAFVQAAADWGKKKLDDSVFGIGDLSFTSDLSKKSRRGGRPRPPTRIK